jgi:DNA-binding transcriptional LysR family regulator
MKNLTLRQLRGFVTVAAEASFSRAAGKLALSPSALTIAIRDLEVEIGLPLFNRTTRSVALTDAGSTFLPVAIAALEGLGEGVEALRAQVRLERGSVVLAATSSFVDVVVAPAVVKMARSHPAIRVRIVEDVAEDMVDRVERGEADFGVTTSWQIPSTLDSHLLLTDKFGVVCDVGHPLVRSRSVVSWIDVADYPLVSMASGAGIRQLIDNNRAVAKVLPLPTYEVSSVASLMALVGSGAGIAILPSIAALSRLGRNLAFRPVSRPSVLRDLTLIRRRGHTLRPAAQLLYSHVLAEVHELKESGALSHAASKAGGGVSSFSVQ